MKKTISGKVVKGHGVASGQGKSRYPAGTISLQKPYFKEKGLDLDSFFEGTLNIDICPSTFKILKPDLKFPEMFWIATHQPETFSFCRCTILYQSVAYNALVYYPHPKTKEVHFQPDSVLEVLAPHIQGIRSGAMLDIEIDTENIEIMSESS